MSSFPLLQTPPQRKLIPKYYLISNLIKVVAVKRNKTEHGRSTNYLHSFGIIILTTDEI